MQDYRKNRAYAILQTDDPTVIEMRINEIEREKRAQARVGLVNDSRNEGNIRTGRVASGHLGYLNRT